MGNNYAASVIEPAEKPGCGRLESNRGAGVAQLVLPRCIGLSVLPSLTILHGSWADGGSLIVLSAYVSSTRNYLQSPSLREPLSSVLSGGYRWPGDDRKPQAYGAFQP